MLPINDNVIRLPNDRERNPDDYAKRCPHCGGITFVITLADHIRCFECEEFYEFDGR
jgi:hypothetical protein